MEAHCCPNEPQELLLLVTTLFTVDTVLISNTSSPLTSTTGNCQGPQSPRLTPGILHTVHSLDNRLGHSHR
jgi:hypothetical protein